MWNTNAPESGRPLGGFGKRAVDVVLAASAILLLLPLFIAIAGMIRFSGSGRIIFAHPRVGFGNSGFACWKFRTMSPNADEILLAHLASDPVAAMEWQAMRKLKRDPRVTALGYILRKTSADELPQLLNVLRGDMSLVGPRPIVVEELENYGPDAAFYLNARPGLTGLWQTSGRSDVAFHARVKMDRQYVENWSFGRDLAIILKTVRVVLLGRGTY